MRFEEFGGKTRFTLRHSGLPVDDMLEMTEAGRNESFDRLAEVLKALRYEAGPLNGNARWPSSNGGPDGWILEYNIDERRAAQPGGGYEP